MEFERPNDRHFGHSSEVREVAGLRLAERSYLSNFRTPVHSHQRAYFCLILDGTSTQTFGSNARLRKPMMTLFYPPDELQSETFGTGGGRIFNIEVDSRWLINFRKYSVIKDESTCFPGGSVTWLMMRLYEEFLGNNHVSSLAIEGLTLEIIAEASRKSMSNNGSARWLEQARDILHEQFADNTSLASIAGIVGVHPVHLASAFRKHYRCTVGDYRRRLRIEYACRELSRSNLSLAEIALAAGFSHQAHFSRIFKRLMGITPTQYRNSRR